MPRCDCNEGPKGQGDYCERCGEKIRPELFNPDTGKEYSNMTDYYNQKWCDFLPGWKKALAAIILALLLLGMVCEARRMREHRAQKEERARIRQEQRLRNNR